MEQLYHQVSDQQTMGSVVDELRQTLSEAEKHLDQYFRTPEDIKVLQPVSKPTEIRPRKESTRTRKATRLVRLAHRKLCF